MTDGATGMTLKEAIYAIVKYKSFPVALWSQEHYDEYNLAVRVFWETKPIEEHFLKVMSRAPITPDIVWMMTHE